MSLTWFDSLDALPDDTAPLFAGTLFDQRFWYATVIAHGLAVNCRPRFALLRDAQGAPRALLPGQICDGVLQSLTNCYSCAWAPLTVADDARDAARDLAQALGPIAARYEALDPADERAAGFLEGLGNGSSSALRFEQFGHWHEEIGARDFTAYMQGRPGALRSTVERRGRKLMKRGAQFDWIRDGDKLRFALEAYDAIYATSWKEPEPFPRFQAEFARAASEVGVLRMALLLLDDQPVAAQIWTVLDDRASVLKLAHDQKYDELSPGTVLTALALERLIDDDQVAEIDFGRGDDPYKRLWAHNRRGFVGVETARWTRPAEAMRIVRHAAGSLLRKVRS
ncbi:GNAT family N-acetyltransferase [Roseiterribacter gracilis]|uniref:BioF2-like acetyltransferase domain-containing protein n=1 Tax=Roseiterribacter gracilis TaxID=2812848 RepID=A0A8S8XB09_9PROT|nr:hypothetical protein TMPK1_12780 [Rhodospirillales bacterium TMPK1]